MHILKEWVKRICQKIIAFPLSDNFINSPDLLSWLCIDIVSRTLMLLTLFNRLRVRAFEMIWIRISDPRSLGSWKIKWTDESFSRVDSLVDLIYHDPSDLRWLILILIISKERTLRLYSQIFFFLLWRHNKGWAMPSILTTVLFPVLWLSTFI